MEILEFNKEELQKIENLLTISNIISSIYDKLYKLEINGNQDSEDYQRLLKSLEDAIAIEEIEFKNAKLTTAECNKIFKLLLSSNKTLKLNNTECTLFQKYDDKVTRRTMTILSEKIILNEHVDKKISNTRKIQNAILDDILSILLSILTEYISNPKHYEYKNELIKLKYYISFINHNIESQMLTCKFNISDLTYINSNTSAKILGIDQMQYDFVRETETKFMVAKHISEFLEIKDSYYEKTEKNIESIIRQCYIRAILTLMSEDSIHNLNQNFLDLTNSQKYLEKHQNDRISENAIICCFKSQKYDRVKIRSMSSKLPT